MRLYILLLPVLSFFCSTHAALNCSSPTFATLLSGNSATITFAQSLANNASFSPPGGLGPMGPPKGAGGPPKGAGGPSHGMPFGPRVLQVPSLCAMQAKVKSSERSEYSFGIFLPEKWNGRFL
jgi:feruloyl esterase